MEARPARAASLLVAGVWLVSLGPLALEALTDGRLFLAGASRFGVAALPWLAYAGLPRGSGGIERAAGVLHGLPVLGLALGLDLAGGRPVVDLLPAVVGVLGLVTGWALLADRAAARPGYALAWLLLVPLPAAHRAAFAWASPGPGPVEPAASWSLDPLIWLHRSASLGEGPGWAGLLWPVAGTLACSIVALGRRSS